MIKNSILPDDAPLQPIFWQSSWATLRFLPDNHGLWEGPAYTLEYHGPSRRGEFCEVVDSCQAEYAQAGYEQAYGMILRVQATRRFGSNPDAPLGSLDWYKHLRLGIIRRGWVTDIPWSETVQPPTDAGEFWRQYTHVVLNSGMRNTVAQGIYNKVVPAVEGGGSAGDVFKHGMKCAVIDAMYARRHEALAGFLAVPADQPQAQVAYVATLPYMGPIIRYHLAKNLGVDCAKPDRHLERIAGKGFEAVQAFCERLARESGDRTATVDLVLWRAAAIGLIDTRAMMAGDRS